MGTRSPHAGPDSRVPDAAAVVLRSQRQSAGSCLGALLVATFADIPSSDATCTYWRYRWRELPNPICSGRPGEPQGCSPTAEWGCPTCTPGCQDLGWNQSSTPQPAACGSVVSVTEDEFDCATDAQVTTGSFGAHHYCPCDPEFRDSIGFSIRTMADDTNVPGLYQCDTCAQGGGSEPELCNGTDGDNTPPFDEACGDDEHSCSKTGDRDDAPIRFSSGRVETNPLSLFSVPTPDGISFGGLDDRNGREADLQLHGW